MSRRERRHGCRLRKGRVSMPGCVYSVTTVTRDRRVVFDDLVVARRLIGCLRGADGRGEVSTLAFCLMPDHLHWLFRLNGSADLSTVVGRFKGDSARRVPALRWQRGFHDHVVRAEEDLRRLARYVVANPVRAGLVAGVGGYPHWDAVWL